MNYSFRELTCNNSRGPISVPPSLIVLAYPAPMQFNVVSHKSSDLKYQTFLKHNIAPAEVIVKG